MTLRRRYPLIAAAFLCGVVAVPEALAAPKPDLRIAVVSAPSVGTSGSRIVVGVRVVNSGAARARSSTVRLSVSRGRGLSSFPIPALRSRGSYLRRVLVAAPRGRYTVLACADARRQVAERSERNNCARTRTVSIAPVPAPPLFVERPAAVTNVTAARFAFAGQGSFECRLDSAAFAPCTSPVTHAGLPEGPHEFQVRTRDRDGRRSAMAAAAWRIDVTPPAAPGIVDGPRSLTNSPTASFAIDAEPGARLACRMNDSAFYACGRSETYTLPEGQYEFAVRATDAAGNESAVSPFRWRIDLTAPPAPVVSERPPAETYVRSATIEFSFPAAAENTSRECRYDGAAVSCAGPLELAGPLKPGLHVVSLLARDDAGNAAATNVAWTILARGDGVYAGPGGIAPVAAFSAWRGGSPVTHALDYLRLDTWADIEGASSPDIVARWRNSQYRLVLSTPMLPKSGATLALGATGIYNGHFTKLAQKLVAEGHQGAVIRLGWEFNGNWYPWSPVLEPNGAASFKTYWRQIVGAMRAVSPAFGFDWNMNSGANGMADASDAYPGNDVVDYIGLSAFDAAWGAPDPPTPEWRWSVILGQQHGLAWQRDFARRQGKPITYPEWGMWEFTDPGYYDGRGSDGKDDPYYVERMFEWLNSNEVAYALYFNWDSGAGNHALDHFPDGRNRYRALFGSL